MLWSPVETLGWIGHPVREKIKVLEHLYTLSTPAAAYPSVVHPLPLTPFQ